VRAREGEKGGVAAGVLIQGRPPHYDLTMGLGSVVSKLDRWAGKLNRWFGGTAMAVGAEHSGAAGGPPTVDPTAVVAALGEIEREGSAEGEEPGELDGLLHLAALEAAGADVRPGRLAAQQDANPLEVRVEAAFRGHHRMTPVVAEARLLSADGADLGHRRGSVANGL
jgi:hypothetical protein